jgi:hypothetical protein
MKLNDVPIATCGTPCFYVKSAFTVSDWRSFARTPTSLLFGAGYLNTLTVVVKNTHAGLTPTGLFVRARVTAVCSKCTSPVPEPYQCGGNPSTC